MSFNDSSGKPTCYAGVELVVRIFLDSVNSAKK